MADEDISNGEIARRLDALTDEFRALRQELVRRDVYEEARGRDRAEVDALRTRVENAESTKRQAQIALSVAVLAFVFDLVLKLLWPHVG